MSCPRCAGLMVPVGLIDWDGAYLLCPAHKCMNCGNVVDAVIAGGHQYSHACHADRAKSSMSRPAFPNVCESTTPASPIDDRTL